MSIEEDCFKIYFRDRISTGLGDMWNGREASRMFLKALLKHGKCMQHGNGRLKPAWGSGWSAPVIPVYPHVWLCPVKTTSSWKLLGHTL